MSVMDVVGLNFEYVVVSRNVIVENYPVISLLWMYVDYFIQQVREYVVNSRARKVYGDGQFYDMTLIYTFTLPSPSP